MFYAENEFTSRRLKYQILSKTARNQVHITMVYYIDLSPLCDPRWHLSLTVSQKLLASLGK